MQEYYCELLLRQQCLEESIQEVDSLSKEIARLSLLKEKATSALIAALGHAHEGQKTYDYEMWKIEVRASCIYALDKKKYESIKSKIPPSFNPVKESTSYLIDKRMCDKLLIEAPKEVRDVLCEIIEKKPRKSNVSVKERFQ